MCAFLFYIYNYVNYTHTHRDSFIHSMNADSNAISPNLGELGWDALDQF